MPPLRAQVPESRPLIMIHHWGAPRTVLTADEKKQRAGLKWRKVEPHEVVPGGRHMAAMDGALGRGGGEG